MHIVPNVAFMMMKMMMKLTTSTHSSDISLGFDFVRLTLKWYSPNNISKQTSVYLPLKIIGWFDL